MRNKRWIVAVSTAMVALVATIGVLTLSSFLAARSSGRSAIIAGADEKAVAMLGGTFWHERTAALSYVEAPSPATIRAVYSQHHEFQRLAAVLPRRQTAQEARLRAEAAWAENAYYASFTRVRAAISSGSQHAVKAAVGQLQAMGADVLPPLNSLERLTSVRGDAAQVTAESASNQVLVFGIAAVALTILPSVAIAVFGTQLVGQGLRREEELAAALVRLEELTRVKEDFVALVSHELRTPLTSIIGYLELLADPDMGALDEQQRTFTAVMERNAERLLRLVGDLLFLAGLQSGKLSIEQGEMDLADVARRAVEAARPAAERKHIELVFRAAPMLTVPGDEGRIAQLLDNLLSNAVKFTPEKGRVTVTLGADRTHAVLAVADTGTGISPDEQEHIFERFFRSAAASNQSIQGTGLGLTICQAIADAHGGIISVQSEPDHGATFQVRLPLAAKIISSLDPRA